MKRQIHLAETQVDYSVVNGLLLGEWVLDPDIYDGRPCRLGNAIVYHLIKYESEEEKPVDEEIEGRKVVSIKSVPINEADELLKQGYELKDTYAKAVTLVKYAEEEPDV
jgi:hypothetical protein